MTWKCIGKTFGRIPEVFCDCFQCDKCGWKTVFPEKPCWQCMARARAIREHHEEEARAGII